MKFFLPLAALLSLVPTIIALDLELGKSYCLACLETTDRYKYTGVQNGCRGTKRKCNIFGANCDYCYIKSFEQKDLDTLQSYCDQGNGSNSINRKYKTFRVDVVNMSNCQ